jgi:hypothetical protein
MVNNSTNINMTNTHLSPKESLNSYGEQFHQYQQNKHPSLTSNHDWELKAIVLQDDILLSERVISQDMLHCIG